MPLVFIQTSISLGSLGVIAAIIGGVVAFWQIGPVGGSTVEMWQSRCEILERDLKDAKAAVADLQAKVDALTASAHDAELATKDREREIAELRAMPDTQKMLDAFEMNQAAVLKVLGDISTGLETLINRDQSGRSGDAVRS